MGYYIHLHVAFACDNNDAVAVLARKHLSTLTDACEEAKWFLEALAGRTGSNPGPKGGLSLWGIVGNYTDAAQFAEQLAPFWTELLSSEIDGGPLNFERVMVFSEREQSESAEVIQIGLVDNALVLKRHTGLPFAWGQH